jgi:hypothetical protein
MWQRVALTDLTRPDEAISMRAFNMNMLHLLIAICPRLSNTCPMQLSRDIIGEILLNVGRYDSGCKNEATEW